MTAEEGKKGAAKKNRKTPDRAALKKKLKALKKGREEAKTKKEISTLARIRRQYRRLTRALRRTAAPKPKVVKAE